MGWHWINATRDGERLDEMLHIGSEGRRCPNF